VVTDGFLRRPELGLRYLWAVDWNGMEWCSPRREIKNIVNKILDSSTIDVVNKNHSWCGHHVSNYHARK